MSSKILAAAIGLSLLSWATPTKAQQRSQPEIESILQQLPSQIEQLTKPSQIREFQRLAEEEPLLNLFLELDQAELPNLQQIAEEQIRQTLRQPPSLQQQLFQQQIRGTLNLDEL
jgi:multidrug efflux pump subunit AcrB